MSLPSPSLGITGVALFVAREYTQPQLRERRILRAALDDHAETKIYYAL
jgi:hypothetical protein